MSLLTFRLSIAEALLKSAPLPPPVKPGRPPLNLSTVENNTSVPQRAAPSPLPARNGRFDKYDHWSVQTEKADVEIQVALATQGSHARNANYVCV